MLHILTITTDDPALMKPADASAAIAEVRAVLANVETLRELGHDLDVEYAKALQEP